VPENSQKKVGLAIVSFILSLLNIREYGELGGFGTQDIPELAFLQKRGTNSQIF